MKVLAGLFVGLFLLQTAHAQLLTDHFSYNNGSLGASGVGSELWTGGDSPSPAIQVNTTATLTNSQLAGIAGSGVVMSGGTFKKRNASFTSQSSGSVYVSFLLNIQAAGSGAKAFVYLNDTTSATGSPELGIFLDGTSIGIGKNASAPAASTTLSAGTHLIVAAYMFLDGADRVDLWIDPTALGGTNVPSATLTTTSGSDGSSLAVLFLNHAVTQTIWVDEMRVGTSWADVTPSTGSPPATPPSTPIITQLLMAEDGFTINGNNGPTNGQYDVQASTTMDQPASEWPVIATDSFDSNGQFTFIDPDATDATQKFYRVRVHDPNAPVAPSIITQPHDTTNTVGDTATLSVSASGTAPLFYQWFFNLTTPLTNGTGTALSLANVQTNQSGGYSVLISNVAGSVTSVVAQLVVTNVVAPPTITAQPQSQTVTIGQTVNFNVTATGTQPLFYEWYFDDVTLVGTNPVLTLTGVTTNDAGNYSVVVSNTYGTATSSNATLTVNTNAPPNFSAVGFCNNGGTVTGGAAGPTVYVGSESQLQAFSDINPPYTIYITNSFNLSGMSTHIRSNKTVIGVGNIVLTGGGLYLYRSDNVIIRNLTITDSTEDNIGVHYSKRVWIDHCTIKNATDGGIDLTQESDFITISWCKFIYDTNAGHNFVNLLAASDGENSIGKLHTTFHHNWWSTNCVERLPSVRFGRAHVYNNYYNAPGNAYCVRTRLYAECLVENNFFQNVKNPWERYITSGDPGKLYATNNNVAYLETLNGVTWGAGGSSVLIPGTNAVFTPPYSYTLDNAADVPNIVTENAGAGKGPFAP